MLFIIVLMMVENKETIATAVVNIAHNDSMDIANNLPFFQLTKIISLERKGCQL